MPRTKPALSENKAPGVRQEPSSPTPEHRKSEKGSKPPGSAATRPPHTRPQLCKHCAASARRRSSCGCLHCPERSFQLVVRQAHLAQKCIPPRIVVKIG